MMKSVHDLSLSTAPKQNDVTVSSNPSFSTNPYDKWISHAKKMKKII